MANFQSEEKEKRCSSWRCTPRKSVVLKPDHRTNWLRTIGFGQETDSALDPASPVDQRLDHSLIHSLPPKDFPFRQTISVKTYSTHNMPEHAIPQGRVLSSMLPEHAQVALELAMRTLSGQTELFAEMESCGRFEPT